MDTNALAARQQQFQAEVASRTDANAPAALQQQRQQQLMMKARQRQFEKIQQGQQQKATSSDTGKAITPQPRGNMGPAYGELPLLEPNDLGYIGPKPAFVESFEAACRDGPLSTVRSIVSSETRTPVFLHTGLEIALRAANINVASYLLSAGAPIIKVTPSKILSAPPDQQIPLFELLAQHGWEPSIPSYNGSVLLLPRVVTNPPLLSWFLSHGANPNLGEQQAGHVDGTGALDTRSCAALEAAASEGNVEAVRMLLDAGAEIKNGVPLHCAAGKCPPGTNPHTGRVTPSKEFDVSMIPVMALLVERGADVNQAEESRHMVARYAVVYAVMAGALERVKWLLEAGADPNFRGAWGSAVTYAEKMGSEEMQRTIDEVLSRRRIQKTDIIGETP